MQFRFSTAFFLKESLVYFESVVTFTYSKQDFSYSIRKKCGQLDFISSASQNEIEKAISTYFFNYGQEQLYKINHYYSDFVSDDFWI